MRSACFPAFGSAVLPLLFVFSASCAPEKGGVEKQLSKLQDEVRHLQSETDRMAERLDAVAARRVAAPREAEPRDGDERVANNSGTLTRPKLKIVRMEPGDDGAVEDPPEASAPAADDDTGPRLLIQGEGKSVESRQLSGTAPAAAKSSKSDSKSRKSDAAKSDAAKSDATKSDAAKSDAASAK